MASTLTYTELLQKLKSLTPSATEVEALLREYFSDDAIGSEDWAMVCSALTATSLTAQTLQLVVDGQSELEVGQFAWDPENHTVSIGLEFGSMLQLGMENLRYVHNLTGADIPDGKAVFFDSAAPDDHLTVDLVDASLNGRISGLATSVIPDDGHGWVAKDGRVRDIPTIGLTLGQDIYADPLTPGGMTNTRPEWPDYILFIGTLIKDNGDDTGDVELSIQIVQRDVPTPVCLATYSAIPERNALENIHGGFAQIISGHDLSAGDLTLTGATSQGIGKLVVVVNVGADLDGEITVSGTTVDRDTGATDSHVDTLAIDSLTTDTSGADSNGVEHHDIVGGYITDHWFDGADDVVISSSDTTITDIDVYQISFEQFNSARILIIKSLDMNVLCAVQASASISAYMYKVVVVGDKVTIQSIADIVKNDFITDRYYRLRRGAIDLQLDGRMDGIFVEQAYLGTPSKFRDAGLKVWAEVIL